MDWFVRPDTVTLPLSNGQWLLVRKRLSAGERRAKYARLYMMTVKDGTHVRQVNPEQVGLASVTAYLLDWSLRDHDGTPVVIKDLPIDQLEMTLNQLTPEAYDEIEKAIETHDDSMAQKKTIPNGEPASSATSSSPPASGGATNGSVT